MLKGRRMNILIQFTYSVKQFSHHDVIIRPYSGRKQKCFKSSYNRALANIQTNKLVCRIYLRISD